MWSAIAEECSLTSVKAMMMTGKDFLHLFKPYLMRNIRLTSSAAFHSFLSMVGESDKTTIDTIRKGIKALIIDFLVSAEEASKIITHIPLLSNLRLLSMRIFDEDMDDRLKWVMEIAWNVAPEVVGQLCLRVKWDADKSYPPSVSNLHLRI